MSKEIPKSKDYINQMTDYFIKQLQDKIDRYVADPNPAHHDFNQHDGFQVAIGISVVTKKVAEHFKHQGFDVSINDKDDVEIVCVMFHVKK